MKLLLLFALAAAGPHAYKVRRGDDPMTIARRNHLHAPECGKAVMTGNAITDPRNLEVGKELIIPHEIRHVVKPGETVSTLAREYYRSTKQARLILECNGLSGEQLKVGSVVYVPIFEKEKQTPVEKSAPVAKSAAVDEPAPVVEAPPPEVVPVAESAPADDSIPKRVRAAVKSYRDGDYDEGCRELQRLLVDPRLANTERATVIEHCAYCEVAYGNVGVARDYFRSWLALKPDATLDQITTSPKVLDALDQARRDIAPR